MSRRLIAHRKFRSHAGTSSERAQEIYQKLVASFREMKGITKPIRKEKAMRLAVQLAK